MSAIKEIKIDRFYALAAAVLVTLAIVIAVVLNGIFSALAKAGEIDEELLQSLTPRINRQQLDEAFAAVTTKETKRLDLKE